MLERLKNGAYDIVNVNEKKFIELIDQIDQEEEKEVGHRSYVICS